MALIDYIYEWRIEGVVLLFWWYMEMFHTRLNQNSEMLQTMLNNQTQCCEMLEEILVNIKRKYETTDSFVMWDFLFK